MDKELKEFEKEIATLANTNSNSKVKKAAVISRKPQLRQNVTNDTTDVTTQVNNESQSNNNNTESVKSKLSHPLCRFSSKIRNSSNCQNYPLRYFASFNTNINKLIYVQNHKLIPNSSLSYGLVRGNVGTLANHYSPYGNVSNQNSNATNLLSSVNLIQNKTLEINQLNKIAKSNLTIASMANQRLGINNNNNNNHNKSIAIDNAINNATIKANNALMNTNQSLRNINNTIINNKFNNNNLSKLSKKKKKLIATHKCQLRSAGGATWVDQSMTEWPENDFRIFCGDLGNEVSDNMLSNAFNKYKSFVKAKVIRDKRTGKSKGYGFVSFLDPKDFIAAFKEMNGKYVGNRPIKLRKSKWQHRQKKVKNFTVKE